MAANEAETKPSPYVAPAADAVESRSLVWLATLAGHLIALGLVLFALIASAFCAHVLLGSGDDPAGDRPVRGAILGGLALAESAMIVPVEVVTIGMHLRRRWAYIAGLAMFAIALPSIFVLVGAMGFVGLLAPGSRREFGA